MREFRGLTHRLSPSRLHELQLLSAALAVILTHDFPEDLLVTRTRADCTKKQDQEAVLGHSHLALTLLHCSIEAKYQVGVVVVGVALIKSPKTIFAQTPFNFSGCPWYIR